MAENFDVLAAEWDKDPRRMERAGIVAHEIIKNIKLKAGMTALEYGCGTGLLSFQLRNCFNSIVLADSSEGMLTELKQKIMKTDVKNLIPVKLDLSLEQPLKTKFDIVYTLMTLHHINDVEGVLSKFGSMLNTSGYLSIADLDEEDGTFHGEGFNGHNGFNRRKLAESLENIGIRVVDDRIIYEVIKVKDGQERRYPLFLMTGEKL